MLNLIPLKSLVMNLGAWQPEHGAQHDWFDVCKMAYLAVDFAIATVSQSRWRFCKSPNLRKRWIKTFESQKAVQQETVPERKSWFEVN